MRTSMKQKLFVATLVCVAFIMMQTFGLQNTDHDKDDKPTNLKVLPKNISVDELHSIMRIYSKSLGVKCNHCHLSKGEGKERTFDFASDAKPEKATARKMIKMVSSINKKYIDKIGNHNFEKITCVTCHNGNIKPLVSTDSLPKKQ